MQTGRGAHPGGPRVRGGPGRRRRRVRRGPLRARAARRAGPDPRRGRGGRAGGLRRGRSRRPAAGSWSASCSPRCGTRPGRWRSPSSRSPGATAAWPGFDIAGAEAGYPPTRHLDAFEYLQRENSHFTIHAGEAFGLPSIWQAIQWCGADRLGHGVRIIDDITVGDDGAVELGRLAAYVRDKRIPLEMCPSSNLQTGAAAVDRRAPDRAADPAALPGHGQHRQPADERDVDDRRDVRRWSRRSATPSRTCGGSRSTR